MPGCFPCAGHEDAFYEHIDNPENEVEHNLEHAQAAALEHINDMQQATEVNYEKVPPAKRRRLNAIRDRLIAPALASLNKEPKVDITSDDSQKEDFNSSD